jgi:hypothetical protein
MSYKTKSKRKSKGISFYKYKKIGKVKNKFTNKSQKMTKAIDILLFKTRKL